MSRGPSFNLLAQPAFLPSVIPSFFTQNKGEGVAPPGPSPRSATVTGPVYFYLRLCGCMSHELASKQVELSPCSCCFVKFILKPYIKNRSTMQTCVAYELPWSQRFFLSLRGSGFLISCREKSRKSSRTGVLTSRFFTYHWNPVRLAPSRLFMLVL